MPRLLLIALLLACLLSTPVTALERIVVKRDKGNVEITGKVLVTAEDGGLLVLSPDGALWTVPPEELVQRTTDRVPFEPASAAALSEQLLEEFPSGFTIHSTEHYLICHNTSRAYAQWCGALFERLYLAFTNYWSRRGFELKEPEFPLVALLFSDKSSYANYAAGELGEATDSIIGYYSLRSNRMTMYDLTGIAALRQPNDSRNSVAQINQMLARPDAQRTVATIIHEATHQIAFNCGMQARYADVPVWVSEGIALYFETPDLKSNSGWRTIGAVNQPRLTSFRNYLKRRESHSLESLIRDDTRMRSTRDSADAYGEAWALSYFLIRSRGPQYLEYMKTLSAKGHLLWDDPATRLAEFKNAFGDDLEALDAEFLRYMSKVR